MKLSEAIRLGSMLKPQGFGSRLAREWRNNSCAMQAAVEAIGGDVTLMAVKAPDYFPILTMLPAQCPACGVLVGSLAGDKSEPVWHLNDLHKWTREQIADWVETFEQQQEAQPAEEPACTYVLTK